MKESAILWKLKTISVYSSFWSWEMNEAGWENSVGDLSREIKSQFLF